MKSTKMGGACGTCGEENKFDTRFWSGKLKERSHLEDLGVDGRIMSR
jgi:hypothetical protein